MKVRIQFKTPDAVDAAAEDLEGETRLKFDVMVRKWVRYGEYATIEIDLDTGEAVVVPVWG